MGWGGNRYDLKGVLYSPHLSNTYSVIFPTLSNSNTNYLELAHTTEVKGSVLQDYLFFLVALMACKSSWARDRTAVTTLNF